jgi:hypothetical protein
LKLPTDSQNRELLIAVPVKGAKKFTAIARKINPSVLNKLSKVSTIVVSAAHIISSADNAKNLAKIDKKVSSLLVVHENSMIGDLEAIFETLQELGRSDIVVSPEYLLDLKMELKKLRSAWIRNITHGLKMIENPKQRSYLTKIFMRKKTAASKMASDVQEFSIAALYIRKCLQLEELIEAELKQYGVYEGVSYDAIVFQLKEMQSLIGDHKKEIAKLTGDELASEQAVSSLSLLLESLPTDVPSVNIEVQNELS